MPQGGTVLFDKYFKALGEPTRIRIIKLLSNQELCVCDLEKIMDVSQPRISQHLKILKQVDLISERREAQRRICSLNWNVYKNVMKSFEDFLVQPLSDTPGFESECRRLQDLEPGLACLQKQTRAKSRQHK